jgi:hypothetical protein
MDKAQLKIVQDSKKVIDDLAANIKTVVETTITKVEEEKDKLETLQASMQDAFDDLSEEAQQGDKGTKMEEEINSIGEIIDELDNIKGEIDDEPFEDVVTKYEDVEGIE